MSSSTIWIIAWQLWEQHNTQLHNNGTTIHFHKMSAFDDKMQNKWDTGLDQLPQYYLYLFEGTQEDQVKENVNQKLMWLTSIWMAQDNEIRFGPMRQRNSTINTIYDPWKNKIK
jgi:hypothetical protein